MKRKFYKRITLFLVLALSLCIIILINRKSFHFRYNGYKIYNEKGDNLPITLFKREINHNYGLETEPLYEEILVWFNKDLNMGIEDMLVVLPNDSFVAYPGGGKRAFYNIGNIFLFQKEHSFSNELQNLLNDRMYYNSPIKFCFSKDNKIMFNTYGDLKKYGDTVIIEKVN